MKLANPLYYPVAVLFGGITLVVGVRLVQVPSQIMLPMASGITIAGAIFFKSRETQNFELDNPELEREIIAVKASALALANNFNDLRLEAAKLLTDSFQMELLVAVQINCDRAAELPAKVDTLIWNLHGNNSILSVNTLQQQLTEVEQKITSSSGVSKQHLTKLAKSLRRNIKLVKEGEDTRVARVINISTLIQDSAGVLQQLQTQLRTSDLSDSEQINKLQLLTNGLSSLGENIDLLIRK
jgi:hypothetical protein